MFTIFNLKRNGNTNVCICQAITIYLRLVLKYTRDYLEDIKTNNNVFYPPFKLMW